MNSLKFTSKSVYSKKMLKTPAISQYAAAGKPSTSTEDPYEGYILSFADSNALKFSDGSLLSFSQE